MLPLVGSTADYRDCVTLPGRSYGQMYAKSKVAAIKLYLKVYSVQMVCNNLEKMVTWCLVKQICPREASDLEGCIGYKGKSSLPPAVPRRCQKCLDALDSCMEAHTTQHKMK